jgi:hypothetical protein
MPGGSGWGIGPRLSRAVIENNEAGRRLRSPK